MKFVFGLSKNPFDERGVWCLFAVFVFFSFLAKV